jgi:hypothetical protein
VNGGVERVRRDIASGRARGERLGGGDHHLHRDRRGAHRQRTAEQPREREGVVDRAAVGGERGPRGERIVGLELRLRVGEREDDLTLADLRRLDEAGLAGRRDDDVGLREESIERTPMTSTSGRARIAASMRPVWASSAVSMTSSRTVSFSP